jgi:DNA-binding MltR family transcriptional regulator
MPKRSRKPKLRDYSKIDLTTDEYEQLRKVVLQLEQQSIANAIVGAVMVEHELDALLRRRFKRNDDETWDKLVSDQGPLASFYAKITAGYALGIYDKKLRDDLHIVRSIRNAFAHSKRIIDFNDELIIAELSKANCLTRGLKNHINEPMPYLPACKVAYITLCQEIALSLLKRQTKAAQASVRRMRQKMAKLPFARAFGYDIPFDPAKLKRLQELMPRIGDSDTPRLGSLGEQLQALSKSNEAKDK